MEHKEMRGMGTIFIPFFLAASLVLTGCATVKDIHQQYIESIRRPGENMERGPEETLQNYPSCTEQSMPPLFETEVIPERVVPSKEVNLRIRYSTCLSAGSAPKKGEIIRTVHYQNRLAFRDKTRYEFKPGTWTVDAFIKVPDDAKPGTYTVESTIIYKNKLLKKIDSFQVKDIQEGK
jgi:hypothetical protein